MELTLDYALASAVFLVGLTVFLSITLSQLSYLTLQYSSYCPVKAYIYPVKFKIEASSKGKYIVETLDGRVVHVYVVVLNSSSWRIYEGATPLEVPAGPGDWIIALSHMGYGVKRGTGLKKTVIVTIRGVVSDPSPKLKPYVVIRGSSYTVCPEEKVVTAGGSETKYSEALVEKYKVAERRIAAVEDYFMLEVGYRG